MIRLFITIFLFLVMQSSFAAAGVGHVVWSKGSFTANGRALQRSSPIFVSDVLRTGPSSEGGITFTDGTLMSFKENSQYSVDSYKFKTASNSSFTGSLVTGGFRTVTGQIAKQNSNNYAISTPVATIGVRGTDYQAVYQGGYLYVQVFKGTVCINPYGGTAPYECPTGLYSILND